MKVLPPEFAADPERLRRFQLEAEAVAALNHPNILAIHDIGVTADPRPSRAPPGRPSLPGHRTARRRDAARTDRARAAPGLRRARHRAPDGAGARRGARQAHRPSRPQAVERVPDDRRTGRSCWTSGSRRSSGLPQRTSRSRRDRRLFRPRKPAAADGHGGLHRRQSRSSGLPTDARSDIFSFGAVLYEMLTGRRAFAGDTAADTLSAILTKEPPPLAEACHNAPTALQKHRLPVPWRNAPRTGFRPRGRWQHALEVVSQDVRATAAVALTPGGGRHPAGCGRRRRSDLPAAIAVPCRRAGGGFGNAEAPAHRGRGAAAAEPQRGRRACATSPAACTMR